jgi:hypothetical protein
MAKPITTPNSNQLFFVIFGLQGASDSCLTRVGINIKACFLPCAQRSNVGLIYVGHHTHFAQVFGVNLSGMSMTT